VIATFADEETRKIYKTGKSRRFGSVARSAARRLGDLEFAIRLDDLKNPPGDRLEKLKGDRAGQYSLRINDQYRVCFRWVGDSAYDVEIVDYH
jgi:proteic killer suppression protein